MYRHMYVSILNVFAKSFSVEICSDIYSTSLNDFKYAKKQQEQSWKYVAKGARHFQHFGTIYKKAGHLKLALTRNFAFNSSNFCGALRQMLLVISRPARVNG